MASCRAEGERARIGEREVTGRFQWFLAPSTAKRRRYRMPSRRPRPGFTLIELLVVIAIIAILAAILFPVFAQAREKARQATCLSQATQWGIAVDMYKQDYDEMYPC